MIGVGLYDKSARIYAPTDADGFYSIMLPTGARELDVTGYSLENYTLHLDVQSDGELDVLLAKVPVALSAEVELQDESQYLNYSIPEKVLEKLLKED